ncbi:hypothetical protein CC2G_001605 [Coprinopsis cinerea AmutBmut pab1-1]|nr:hypothetical protein CC2G_001605 [Coprinopsis cinerea AmutBmut pab1-1]
MDFRVLFSAVYSTHPGHSWKSRAAARAKARTRGHRTTQIYVPLLPSGRSSSLRGDLRPFPSRNSFPFDMLLSVCLFNLPATITCKNQASSKNRRRFSQTAVKQAVCAPHPRVMVVRDESHLLKRHFPIFRPTLSVHKLSR